MDQKKQLARTITIITLTFILILCYNSSPAQIKNETDIIKAPPFQAHSHHFMIALFHFKAKQVNGFLPKGIIARENEEGWVTAAFEMYETDRIYGLPNYKVAFFVVDIVGYDSENGTPGHFAIWGNITPREASENFNYHFGFPFVYEENIAFKIKGDIYEGTIGPPGKEKIKFELQKISDKPLSGSGIVNMVGKTTENKMVISEVPWLSEGNIGKLARFEIDPQGYPVLEILKDAKPFWAAISYDQIFSYSKPLTK